MYEQFLYEKPKSTEEALALMRDACDDFTIYAGGTDVLVKLRAEKLHISLVIDIKDLPGLREISETEDEIRIGAAVTHSEIQDNALIRDWYPALCHAVSEIGSVPIRNKATLGGNIQNASPAGDGVIAAFALDAQVEAVSAEGMRRIPLAGFFLNPDSTLLAPGEILTTVILPKRRWSDQRFFKVGRRNALAISVVNGTVALDFAEDKTVSDCRIALGAVAPTPIRIRQAEQRLLGHKLNEALIEEVVACVRETVRPISDIRASAEYRQYIAGVQVKRQLQAIDGRKL